MTQRVSQNDETTRRPTQAEQAAAASTLIVMTVLSHPDPQRIGERAALVDFFQQQEPVELSRHSPRFSPLGSPWDRPLDDPYLSRKPWRLCPEEDGMKLMRGESPIGLKLNGTRVQKGALLPRKKLMTGVTLELSDRIALFLHGMPSSRFMAAESEPEAAEMVGASTGLLQAKRAIDRVADLEVPVLVRGESGTGKELVARAIHRQSKRANAPFVAVDMGVLSPALAASELFGHAKGAFTGASTARQGFFRAADGGTLFLDEIGEASAEVQAMLLRVLETREVVPVGSHQPISVDVRLIAATDADLEARVREGDFKEPLLHRLAAYMIELPALRERREDLGRLFIHLARPVLRELGEEDRLHRIATGPPWLPAGLIARLARQPWTGNVRQLANVVRQLVIDSRDEKQLRENPQLWTRLGAGPAEESREETAPSEPNTESPETANPTTEKRRPSEFSEEEVEQAMESCCYEPAAAARALGIPRPSLYKLVRRHPTLRLASDIPAEELANVLQGVDGSIADAAQVLTVSKRALQRRLTQLGLMTEEKDL